MKDVATDIKRRYPQSKRWTIQQCLYILGAPFDEVYNTNRQRAKICPTCKRMVRPKTWTEKRKGTIYDRFSAYDLRTWVDNLFREAMKTWHPDRHPESLRDRYTEKCQVMSEAYERAKKILWWHGVKDP